MHNEQKTDRQTDEDDACWQTVWRVISRISIGDRTAEQNTACRHSTFSRRTNYHAQTMASIKGNHCCYSYTLSPLCIFFSFLFLFTYSVLSSSVQLTIDAFSFSFPLFCALFHSELGLLTRTQWISFLFCLHFVLCAFLASPLSAHLPDAVVCYLLLLFSHSQFDAISTICLLQVFSSSQPFFLRMAQLFWLEISPMVDFHSFRLSSLHLHIKWFCTSSFSFFICHLPQSAFF